MAMTPIKLTLYEPESGEELKTYTAAFIPWRLLKKAAGLQDIDQSHLTEADIDNIATVVIETFGGKFTLDELNAGAEVGEMMSVITAITTQASGGSLNPTPPARKRRQK